MAEYAGVVKQSGAGIPADDMGRALAVARPNSDEKLAHLGVVGDTYTILLSGKDTAGRFCLVDMHVPPGGGPPPHRHDFEETFSVLEGELEATFRGAKQLVRAGETIHIPANAPHQFRNASSATGANAVHLCPIWPGGVLQGDWHPGRDPHYCPTEARRSGASGVPSKSCGASSEVSN